MKTTTTKSASGYLDVSVDSNGIVHLSMCERGTDRTIFTTNMPIDGAKALVLRLIRAIEFFGASKAKDEEQ